MEKTFRVGVFHDLGQARHAVDDAMAAGVSRRQIVMVVPEDQRDIDSHSEFIVHPTSDTERGHIGGGLGAALGGLLGSLTYFLMESQQMGLWLGLLMGAIWGGVSGAVAARWLPEIIRLGLGHSHKSFLGGIGHGYDTRRSMIGGAIGGAMGGIAGTASSFLMGIPDMWYFLSSGLGAAAISLLVGGLIGAMSARGLAPRALGNLENLADTDNILVSIDCAGTSERQIEELLQRDGAMMVRPA